MSRRAPIRIVAVLASGTVAGTLLLSASPVLAQSGPSASPTPYIQSCTPYRYYQPSSWYGSFRTSSPLYSYTIRNGGGTWNVESFTVSSSQTYTSSVTWSASTSITAGEIVQGTASEGFSVSQQVTKTSGRSLTANLNTPPGYYAHFQSGAWSEASHGSVVQVYSNCTYSAIGTVYSANAPKTNDVGINDWYNTTA